MSKSRDRRVKGFNKAAVRRLEDLPREARTRAGQAGRLAAPSVESLQIFIKAQLCPWCGSGPYKLLATHTHKAHGVSAAELREMAGLIKTAAICAPEISERKREEGRLRGMPASALTAPRRKRVYSAAGAEVNRAKLDAARSPEQRAAATRASRAAALAANRDKHEQILRLFAEGKPVKEIEDAVGCSQSMFRSVLERAGIRVDGRSLRWDRAPDEQRAGVAGRLAENRARRKAALEARRESIVREYEDAGATYAEVRRLAAVHGVTVKSMAGLLRDAGARVPDGRADSSPSRFTDADRAEMARMYVDGASQSQVARHFGANQAYVSVILREAGIPTRAFRHPRAKD